LERPTKNPYRWPNGVVVLEEGDALISFWYFRLLFVKETTHFLTLKVVLSCWKVGHESIQKELKESKAAVCGPNQRTKKTKQP
jgi:hypothetical protein